MRAQVVRTLADLQTSYLDLICIHWPVPGKHVDAYVELQKLQAEGLVRSLGVSNYALEDYDELVAAPAVTVPPAVNQIEINPFLCVWCCEQCCCCCRCCCCCCCCWWWCCCCW